MLEQQLFALKLYEVLYLPASDIDDKAKLRGQIYAVGKSHKMKFATRMIIEKEVLCMRVRRIPIDMEETDVNFDFDKEEEEVLEPQEEVDEGLTPLPDLGLFKKSNWEPSYCFACNSWGPDLRTADTWDHGLLLCLQHIEKCKGIGSMITLKEVYLAIDPMIRLYPNNRDIREHMRDTLSRFHSPKHGINWISKKEKDGEYWLTDKGRNYKGKGA